jgi:hypothetical protein
VFPTSGVLREERPRHGNAQFDALAETVMVIKG